jgi:hypothetical protein
LKIEVQRSQELSARSSELSGFAGEMTRYYDAGDAVNHAGSGSAQPDSLIELLQTGDRLTYTPSSAAEEIARLPQRYKTALADVQQMVSDAEKKHATAAGAVAATPSEASVHQMVFLKRAVALLQDAEPSR